MTATPENDSSRRDFLRVGGAAAVGAAVTPAAFGGFHPGGTDTIRVGLVGCGGRGSGAALNALQADPQVQLVALGDAFGDQLKRCLGGLKNQKHVAERVNVDEDHQFVGFDAYKQVIDSVDVVLFATSPHFRPQHVRYAVEQGKHIFCEKPVATDAPGLRHIWESCEMAAQKGLSLVSGLCYRYEFKKRETQQRIHDGAIGEITAMQTSYLTGGLWHRAPQPGWSEMENQMRNWLYYTWLSGDHIAEQHIHSLDKVLWAMKDEAPVKCTSSGGRIVRTDPKWGNVYDHFNTVFEWKNGVKAFSRCRQWSGSKSDVSDHCFGTKGTAHIQQHKITGENAWRARRREADDMYQNEHDALFAAIKAGEPINNGDYMCKSTLMAIMGRMAAYTGQEITWEQALNSQEKLGPDSYAWGDVAAAPIARPGITKFS